MKTTIQIFWSSCSWCGVCWGLQPQEQDADAGSKTNTVVELPAAQTGGWEQEGPAALK